MRSSLSKQVILYKDHKLTKSLPLHHFLYFHRNITMSLIYNPLWLYWGPSERSLFLCYHFTFIEKKGKLNVPQKGKVECPPKRERWMSPQKGKLNVPPKRESWMSPDQYLVIYSTKHLAEATVSTQDWGPLANTISLCKPFPLIWLGWTIQVPN